VDTRRFVKLLVRSTLEGHSNCGHIAARVAALAEEGKVLVSSTVRDLVAGSNIQFIDEGARALRGIPEELRLYSVAT
jgi:class 3 adenylate cyclase